MELFLKLGSKPMIMDVHGEIEQDNFKPKTHSKKPSVVGFHHMYVY
jgi:hypothetical protein